MTAKRTNANTNPAFSSFSASSKILYEHLRKIIYAGPYKGKITDLEIYGEQRAAVVHVREGRIPVPRASIGFITSKYIKDLCESFAANLGLHFGDDYPVLACRTPDGDRFHGVTGRESVDSKIAVAIRIKRMKEADWSDFPYEPTSSGEEDMGESEPNAAAAPRPMPNVGWDDFRAENNALANKYRDIIERTVSDGGAVLISGATGAGKTTFQNMICRFIPGTDSIITIEDTREIELLQPWVRNLLVPRTSGARNRVGWADHIDNAVRLNPDVIVPGEVSIRNAFYLLQAMDTGHDSIITTMHANSPADAILGFRRRVAMSGAAESEVNTVDEFLAETISVIVQVKQRRQGVGGQCRVITDVTSPKDVLLQRRRSAEAYTRKASSCL